MTLRQKLCRSQSGFTVIEILVVISIIGILAAIVLASLLGSKSGSRDSVRLSDIKQIQSALDLYASEHSYLFPTALTALAPDYVTAIPKDPLTGLSYSYAAFGSGICANGASSYHLGASLENLGNKALINDSDAARLTTGLCTGSADFHGVSAAIGGQPCAISTGVAAGQAGATETCYDIKSQ
jgi:prepilin-type N-terminal cleavage/methylation domain-containing protein